MKTNFTAGWRAMALAGLISVALPALAAPGSPSEGWGAKKGDSMPAEQYQGHVGFVTGGVGQAEAKLFEQQAPQHPLAIELLQRAGKRDEFTAYAMVKITDTKGHTVFDAKADGPFMLVDLAPGRYSIQVKLDNDTLKKSSIRVANGQTARATFEFPGYRTGAMHLSQAEGVSEAGLGG